MLYKVTPMLAPAAKETREVAKQPKVQAQGEGGGELSDPGDAKAEAKAPKQPRKRRKSAVYDGEGNEVLITMMCLKCRSMKPLTMFGLRKMADGAIRNQPWCRTCRSGASSKKKPDAPAAEQDHHDTHDEVHVASVEGSTTASASSDAPVTQELPAPLSHG